MDLNTLEAEYGDAVAEMDVAAPVDLEHLFRDGLIEQPQLEAPSLTLSDEAGVFVAGDVKVDELTLAGHALFVAGNVQAKTLVLQGSMVVMGDLQADTLRGSGEPHVLTVMGEVNVSKAVMADGYILQFLGSGQVGDLVDTEGGAEELVSLWREAGATVQVRRTSDAE